MEGCRPFLMVDLTELSEALRSSALEEVRREGIVFGGGCLGAVVAVRGIVSFFYVKTLLSISTSVGS
jgi:hypothetical protein